MCFRGRHGLLLFVENYLFGRRTEDIHQLTLEGEADYHRNHQGDHHAGDQHPQILEVSEEGLFMIGMSFLPQFKNFLKQIHSVRADSNPAAPSPQEKINTLFIPSCGFREIPDFFDSSCHSDRVGSAGAFARRRTTRKYHESKYPQRSHHTATRIRTRILRLQSNSRRRSVLRSRQGRRRSQRNG